MNILSKSSKAIFILCAFWGVSSAAAPPVFIEMDKEHNVEPGREVAIDLGKLYSLVTVPVQVAMHPAVTENISVLRLKAKQAVALAKSTDADSTFLDPVVTVKTFVRKLPDDGAQKFWIFQTTFRRVKKGETVPEAAEPAGYFVTGAYIRHKGNNVFPLYSNPHKNLPFLKAFGLKDGEFKLPTPKAEDTKPAESDPLFQ